MVEKRLVKMAYVYCKSNEWGNEIMQKKAQDVFMRYPDVEIVYVWEHAGWFLVFRRDMEIIGTANDRACFPEDIILYLQSIKITETVYPDNV